MLSADGRTSAQRSKKGKKHENFQYFEDFFKSLGPKVVQNTKKNRVFCPFFDLWDRGAQSSSQFWRISISFHPSKECPSMWSDY
jgi:hypothetical protein